MSGQVVLLAPGLLFYLRQKRKFVLPCQVIWFESKILQFILEAGPCRGSRGFTATSEVV